MNKLLLLLSASFAFVACKKDPPPIAGPAPTFFVNDQPIVTQTPYRDTGNRVVGALDLTSGAGIRCQFLEYPTANGTYKLVGIKQTLAADELQVTVNPPLADSIQSYQVVPIESDGAVANVRVNDGKISISIPRSRFVEFITRQDTTWVAVDLKEE